MLSFINDVINIKLKIINKMKKYIIITGGAGFVGSNLIKGLLKETNKNLISIDNYSSGSKKNHVSSKKS